MNSQDIGQAIRLARKAQGATQAELAAMAGVGVRFVSDIENGKSSAEVGKVIQLLECLGLSLQIKSRGWN